VEGGTKRSVGLAAGSRPASVDLSGGRPGGGAERLGRVGHGGPASRGGEGVNRPGTSASRPKTADLFLMKPGK
jgi:hypothetical protein